MGGGFPDGDVGVLHDEHEFRGFGWRRCPGEGGEMLAPKSLPRCSSGMGVPWSKAGLVRVKFSGARRSGRAQTSVWCPARRLRSMRPSGFASVLGDAGSATAPENTGQQEQTASRGRRSEWRLSSTGRVPRSPA